MAVGVDLKVARDSAANISEGKASAEIANGTAAADSAVVKDFMGKAEATAEGSAAGNRSMAAAVDSVGGTAEASTVVALMVEAAPTGAGRTVAEATGNG
jgi:hypothetical protein